MAVKMSISAAKRMRVVTTAYNNLQYHQYLYHLVL